MMGPCKNSEKNIEKQKSFPFSNFLEPMGHYWIEAKIQLFELIFRQKGVCMTPGTRFRSYRLPTYI